MKNKTLVHIALIAALLTQTDHAANVFSRIASPDSGLWGKVILSYLFAVSLELSIFVFTLRGRKREATAFAVFSVLINLLYYWQSPGFTFPFMASLAISSAIPVTIWFYSDLVNEDNHPVKRKRKPNHTIKAPTLFD